MDCGRGIEADEMSQEACNIDKRHLRHFLAIPATKIVRVNLRHFLAFLRQKWLGLTCDNSWRCDKNGRESSPKMSHQLKSATNPGKKIPATFPGAATKMGVTGHACYPM